MEYRRLGNTDLHVSVLGLGCSRLGRSVFEDNRGVARELLAAACDHGVNLFDTAPNYAYGDSERLLGEFFAGRRDQVLFATKGGYRYSSSARFARWAVPVLGPMRSALRSRRTSLKQASSKRQEFEVGYLRRCLHASLRRLRTDHVDLYLLHSPPADVIGREETLRFLEEIRRDGKVRVCGASVNSVIEGLLCLGHTVYQALQIGFSLADRRPVRELLPSVAAQGVGVIVKTPLARGLLTGGAGGIGTDGDGQCRTPGRKR
jgi:aryl-alcohol dehydrogenase-like predicted oxidoreductase